MTINKNNIGSQLDKILRPMGITRNLRSYQLICACIVRIFEQEDRLGAVQKEIYMPLLRRIAAIGLAFKALFVEPHRLRGTTVPTRYAGWPVIRWMAALRRCSSWKFYIIRLLEADKSCFSAPF